MGPLLMTALAVLGSSLAIGVVASRTPPPPPSFGLTMPWPPRNLAIILMGFAEGIGVLGVVVGLLAVNIGLIRPEVNRVLAIFPGIAGAVLAILIAFRSDGAPYRQLQTIAVFFIAGLATLAGIVAFLSLLIDDIGTETRADWPFILAGFAAALAAFGIGWLGSEDIRALGSIAPEASRTEMSKRINRVAPLEFIAVAASAGAILALYAGPP
jgi:hypothetical protein